MGERKSAILAVMFSLFLVGSMATIVFGQEENWVEVTRFTGDTGFCITESFAVNNVEWRIKWDYIPTEPSNVNSSFVFKVIELGFEELFFETSTSGGVEEMNGTYNFHKTGNFQMEIFAISKSYTIIIEQNTDSAPVFEHPGNWVEVARVTGTAMSYGESEPFTIDYVDWRIRWQYRDMYWDWHRDFIFYVETHENISERIASVKNPIERNGTLYFDDDYGIFHILIPAPHSSNFTLIIEQNIDSIPEFPSWFILPLFIVAPLGVMIVRTKLSRKN